MPLLQALFSVIVLYLFVLHKQMLSRTMTSGAVELEKKTTLFTI